MKESTTVLDEKSNPLVGLFRHAWRYSKGNHGNVRIYWIMFILANSISLGFHPVLISKVMDTIQKEGVTSANFWHLVWLLSMISLVTLTFWVLHGPARVLERANAYKVRANYKKFLLRGVLGLPLDWHAEHHSGNTIDRIEKGTNGQYAFCSESFNVIASFAQLAVSYCMLAYFSWPSALIVLTMTGITVIITMKFDRRIIENYKVLNSADNQISAGVFDAVSNITTVVILRVEQLVYKSLVNKIDAPYELYCKNSRQIETKWFLVSLCCSFMIIIVLLAYCLQHLNSSTAIMIGSVYLIVNYLGRIEELLFRFTGMYGEVLQRHTKVLNSESLTKDFRETSLTNHVLPDDWQQIEVRNLNFSYNTEGQTQSHLDDVSLNLKRREWVALVGQSGSGKTTLLKVMRGLHQPSSIELSVDDLLIPEGFSGISRAITLVPQKPDIFATTIRENITLGAEYDQAKLERYSNMARFTEVIHKLPKGLAAKINERGVNLSVGEGQRMALVRGFLACEGKSIVMLDEPTSSVDPENEAQIYVNMRKEFADKAVIASLHGLHLLPYFDRVIMFDKGSIIGAGTVEQLMQSCPKFRQLQERYQEERSKMLPVSEGVVEG